MPDIDLRDVVGDIREALQDREREALVEMLTYLFKAYVVEGAAPSAGSVTPALSQEFAGMRFGELISFLQQRVDLPELDLFEVHGERVLLRVGGSHIPIEAAPARPEPPAPSLVTTAVTTAPMAHATPMATSPATTTAMPPARPLVSATVLPTPQGPTNSQGSTGPAAPPAGVAAPRPNNPPATASTPPRAPVKPAEDTSDSAGRFHLLEID